LSWGRNVHNHAGAVETDLTDYEAQQIALIARWKGCHPPAIEQMFNMVAGKVAQAMGKVVPDPLAQKAILGLYKIADRSAGRQEICRKMGVDNLAQLRDWPLDQCDPFARKVGQGALGISVAAVTVTGVGGTMAIALDVPLLFTLAMRTIIKIGRCYGYPLEDADARALVLGILIAALTESREQKKQIRLERLKDVGEKMLTEAQEHLLVEESAALLFQLEALGQIPGMGTVTICLLHLWLIRRVDRAARFVFQERRLRDCGRAGVIEPAVVPHPATDANGLAGIAGRAVYNAIYRVAFTFALPIFLVRAGLASGGRAPARTLRRMMPGAGLAAA
jgi:hypothetical protein